MYHYYHNQLNPVQLGISFEFEFPFVFSIFYLLKSCPVTAFIQLDLIFVGVYAEEIIKIKDNCLLQHQHIFGIQISSYNCVCSFLIPDITMITWEHECCFVFFLRLSLNYLSCFVFFLSLSLNYLS